MNRKAATTTLRDPIETVHHKRELKLARLTNLAKVVGYSCIYVRIALFGAALPLLALPVYYGIPILWSLVWRMQAPALVIDGLGCLIYLIYRNRVVQFCSDFSKLTKRAEKNHFDKMMQAQHLDPEMIRQFSE